MRIDQVTEEHPLTAAMMAACAERGFSRASNFNGADPEGYGPYALNLWQGRRQDAGRAFLEPVADRANLDLLTGATAAQLVLDDARDRVTEVSFVRDGRLSSIEVNEQVLVCAGAVASPQLLMVPGIGRPADLVAVGTGTCRMGPDPADSVVDARLKVHGVDNLRVADLSIMPKLVAGNTTAPAMMIGWRAAEFALGGGGIAAGS